MLIRRVKTENGWVRGLPAADPRITVYRGIPFAAPPVGENRWRAPQPPADWEGDLICHEFAPAAMQPRPNPQEDNLYNREWHIDHDMAMSEDCLYLNVWTPAQGQAGLPVFVWYFGGGLQVGYPSEMEFDGERIARRGVVVVTVNYRLNVFGFLSHPELTAEAPDAPTNFGFLDQQFATRWVKRNIAFFGGDPENITIGGQSAGGMSVGAQIACPENRGLFRRGIIQSGLFSPAYPGFSGLNTTLTAAQARGERFFEEFLGVKTLAEARRVDAQTLLDKALQYPGPWCAVIDGVFQKADSNDWYTRPERVKCPVLAGSTDSEFILAPDASDEDSLRDFARRSYGPEAERFLSLFSHPATAESIRREGAVSAIDFSLCRAARSAGDGTPLYAYQFAMDIPGWDRPGTFHSVDLWFFFETLAKCWRPFEGRHYDLARRMCDYWVNFMRTGDPNGTGSDGKPLPLWPRFTPASPVRMRFDEHCTAAGMPEDPLMAFLLDQAAPAES